MTDRAFESFKNIRKETDRINKEYQINTNNISIKCRGFSLNDLRFKYTNN